MSQDPVYEGPPPPEDGFAARLRQVVSSYGSTNSLARDIQRSEGAIRKWLRGQSEPAVSDLRAICLATNTNVEWLVMGRGDPKPPDRVDEAGPKPFAKVNPSLMEDVIESVGLDAKLQGVVLTAKKCAALLTLVYNASCPARVVDREAAELAVGLALR